MRGKANNTCSPETNFVEKKEYSLYYCQQQVMTREYRILAVLCMIKLVIATDVLSGSRIYQLNYHHYCHYNRQLEDTQHQVDIAYSYLINIQQQLQTIIHIRNNSDIDNSRVEDLLLSLDREMIEVTALLNQQRLRSFPIVWCGTAQVNKNDNRNT